MLTPHGASAGVQSAQRPQRRTANTIGSPRVCRPAPSGRRRQNIAEAPPSHADAAHNKRPVPARGCRHKTASATATAPSGSRRRSLNISSRWTTCGHAPRTPLSPAQNHLLPALTNSTPALPGPFPDLPCPPRVRPRDSSSRTWWTSSRRCRRCTRSRRSSD